MKAGVVVNDCWLPVRLMGVCGEECDFAFIGAVDHFLGGAPFGDGGDKSDLCGLGCTKLASHGLSLS